MKPEARKSFSGERFGLRDLVFVMRENQIFAAGMQIEAFAEFRHRHDGALQVPAGASRADRSVPRSLTRLGRLPQSEIARAVFVVFVDIDTRPVQHSTKIFFREPAVTREAGNAEVI